MSGDHRNKASRSSADKRDIYYRLCKSEGYRARSAYKLLHLDEEFDLFRGVKTAVDLCSAPGSWSQCMTRKLKPSGRIAQSDDDVQIVAVDLQPMAPLPHVTTLQRDITLPSTVPFMLSHMRGRRASLVICDGAPEVTGVHDLDGYLHGELLAAAFALGVPLAQPGATMIFKVFLSPMDPRGDIMASQFAPFFECPQSKQGVVNGEDVVDRTLAKKYADGGCQVQGYDQYGRPGGVWIRKPRSSRAGSAEHFLVCRNFRPVPSGTTSSSALDDIAVVLGSDALQRPTLTLASLKVDLPAETPADDRERIESRWRAATAYARGDLSAMMT